MDLTPVRDAFDRVTKKQKLSSTKTQEMIDHIIQEIEGALEMIRSDSSISESRCGYVLCELKQKLQETAPLNQLEGPQKELNVAVSKFPKQLEKSFNPDISKAYRNVEFDRHTLNQIIAGHFYRQGLFEVGDCFITEAKEPESSDARSLFSEMYTILEAIKGGNLDPAIKWATTNSSKLKENKSDLELKLHQLRFVQILQNGNKTEAFKYVRTYISPFGASHLAEIQKVMSCLLWAGKLDHPPYAELLSPNNWNIVSEELIRQFCNLMGQSFASPLSVTVAAGLQGLSPLLKFMTVMGGKKQQEWLTMKQLPVPVELDREFQFHSVFVCPVSKEQSTDENPPMLMSCGHVLCKQSINKMSKNSSKSFKCPYCPSDIDASQCRQLYF